MDEQHTFSVHDLIYRAISWYPKNDGTFTALIENPKLDETYLEFNVHVPELCKVHSLLPEIMLASAQYTLKTHAENRAPGYYIAQTVKHLNGELMHLSTVKGVDLNLYRVTSFYEGKEKQGQLVLRGQNALIKRLWFADRRLDVVTKTVSGEFTVSFEELDRKYPGWQERIAFCESLDMPKAEQVAYVFPTAKKMAPALSMTPVVFD